MQGNAEMLDFEESCLDTGNMSYRAVLGGMGHAAGPSLFCAWEIFGWWKCSLEFLLLVFCTRDTSRKWTSCPCCSWYLITTKRQKNGHRDGWELEHMPYEDKLSEQLSFTLVPWYLWEGCWADGARRFNVMRDGKTRHNTHKLKQKRFTRVVRGNILHLRAVKQWNRLAEGGVQSLCSQFFKTRLAKALTTWSDVKAKFGLSWKALRSLSAWIIVWSYASMNFSLARFLREVWILRQNHFWVLAAASGKWEVTEEPLHLPIFHQQLTKPGERRPLMGPQPLHKLYRCYYCGFLRTQDRKGGQEFLTAALCYCRQPWHIFPC